MADGEYSRFALLPPLNSGVHLRIADSILMTQSVRYRRTTAYINILYFKYSDRRKIPKKKKPPIRIFHNLLSSSFRSDLTQMWSATLINDLHLPIAIFSLTPHSLVSLPITSVHDLLWPILGYPFFVWTMFWAGLRDQFVTLEPFFPNQPKAKRTSKIPSEDRYPSQEQRRACSRINRPGTTGLSRPTRRSESDYPPCGCP